MRRIHLIREKRSARRRFQRARSYALWLADYTDMPNSAQFFAIAKLWVAEQKWVPWPIQLVSVIWYKHTSLWLYGTNLQSRLSSHALYHHQPFPTTRQSPSSRGACRTTCRRSPALRSTAPKDPFAGALKTTGYLPVGGENVFQDTSQPSETTEFWKPGTAVVRGHGARQHATARGLDNVTFLHLRGATRHSSN